MARNYVYFIRNPKTREIKIGQSENVLRRMKELRRQEECDLELLLVLEAPLVEKELHKKFEEHRTRGEWFKPDTELLEFILTQSCVPFENPEPDSNSFWFYLLNFVGMSLLLEAGLVFIFLYTAYEFWVGTYSEVSINQSRVISIVFVLGYIIMHIFGVSALFYHEEIES